MTEQHLDLDALADLLVGEGDPSHLSSCAACRQALADLEAAQPAVAASLARLAAEPVPAPPADLLDRLPTGLAAPAVPQAPPVGVPAGAVADVVPLRPRSAPRSSALLGVAAGAVGLLAVVGLGVGLVRGGGGGADQASGAAADRSVAAELPDLPATSSGNDYRRDGTVLARALPGLLAPGEGSLSSDTVAGALPDQPAPAAGGKSAGGSSTSGSDGATTRSGEAVTELSVPVDPLARLRDPAELAGCLAELTGPDSDGVPLALDYASFEGQPALVVVLPSAREGKVDVFAVGAGCRTGDDQTLFFSRLDRP